MPEPRILIETVAAPSVNHAMAHNGLRFLHRLAISLSGTDVPVTGVGVDVQVVEPGGQVISRPWAVAVETPPTAPARPGCWPAGATARPRAAPTGPGTIGYGTGRGRWRRWNPCGPRFPTLGSSY